MGSKDVSKAVAGAYSMYGGLFKEVVKEVGMEKALALAAKQSERESAQMAGTLKKKLGGKELDIKTLVAVTEEMMGGSGYTYEIEETPTSLTAKIDKCPLSEGLKMAGLDDKTIKTMCTRMAKAGNDAIKKQFPKVQTRLKFRASPDGFCTEEMILRK